MAARRYRPSGKSDAWSLPILQLGCAGVGVAVGVVEGLVAHHLFSWVGVFPAVLAASVGGFAHWWVGAGRIRAPWSVAAIALLGGLAGQLAVHRTAYELFRLDAAGHVRRTDPGVQPGPAIDAFLVEKTGSPGWLGYSRLVASVGITEVRLGSSIERRVSGIDLYTDWALELLIVALVAGIAGASRARTPFCERCGRWYDLKQRIATGSPRRRDWKAVVTALERGEGAGALAVRGAATPKRHAVYRLLRCGGCEDHEPVLIVSQVTVVIRRGRGEEREHVCYASLVTPALARALLDFGRLEEPITSWAADAW